MIQDFADWLVYGLFGLSADTPLGVAVNFFFYDTIKILILLFFISVLMGIINAYFPIERLRNYLVTHKMYGLQYVLASIFGAITPFCSCSSIPLFIGFVKGGIPLGVTFAFLITSPLVNEVAVAMFLGSFGLKVTLIYVISGILLGVIGGFVLGRMHLSPYLSDWVKQIQASSSAQAGEWEKDHTTFIKRLPVIVRDAWKIGCTDLHSDRYRYRCVYARLCARRIFRAIHVEGQLVCRTAFGHSCRADVCQCGRHCAGHRGIRSQRYSYGYSHCFHDGRGGSFTSGSDFAEKGDDVAADCDILRNGGFLHYLVGLFV